MSDGGLRVRRGRRREKGTVTFFPVPVPVQDEMATLSSSASDVKHMESIADIATFPGSGHVGSLRQCLDGSGQGIGIYASLSSTEMLGGPTQDVPEVPFGRCRQTNAPATMQDHRESFGTTEGPSTTFPAKWAKCRRSGSGASKLWKYPDSMSAMPVFAASRNAIR